MHYFEEICGLIIKIADLRFAEGAQEFSDLRFADFKKSLFAHLWIGGSKQNTLAMYVHRNPPLFTVFSSKGKI